MTIGLVERHGELESLEELLRATALGRCQVALVGGPVGSGKTELLHALAESAMRQDAVVFTALATCAEQVVPMAVISQLLSPSAASETSPGLVRALAEAAAEVLALPPEARLAGDGVLPTPALDALCSALAAAAADRPVVVCVDDVQFADAGSLDCLLHLMHRLRYARVLFVLNESDHHRRYNPLFRVELLRQPGFRRIRVGPLSPAGVEQMAAAELGRDWSVAHGARCHAVSGGNPLLVRALLDDHRTAAALACAEPPDDALETGESYGQAVLACLHRGNEPMLMVARALAVLDASGAPELVDRLVGLAPHEVGQAVEELAVAGVIADGSFRHPAARAAVLDDLSPDHKVRLHRSAARLLHSTGAAATEVAHHLLAADEPDEPWASQILRAAADLALHDDEAELAIRLLKLATRVAVDEDERLAVTIDLVRAEWRVNPALSASRLDSLAAALRDGRLLPFEAIGVAKTMLWHGRVADAVEALSLLGRPGDHSRELAAELGALAKWLRTCYPELLEHLPAVPATGKARTLLIGFESRAAGLLSTVLTGDADDSTLSSAEQILRASELDDTMLEPIEHALLTLVYADQPGRAASWCDPLLDEAVSRNVPAWMARLSSIRALAAVRQGDMAAAERHGETALARLTPRSWGMAVGMPLAALILAKSALGDHDGAAALVNNPVPKGMLTTRYGLHYLHARGIHHLATERLGAALSDFVTCGDLMDRWGIDRPALVPWRSAAASALLRLGEREQAVMLAEEQLEKASPGHSRSRGITLRTLAWAGEASRRPTLLREAVVNLEQAGDRFELGLAIAELEESQAAVERPERSRGRSEQTLRLAPSSRPEPVDDGTSVEPQAWVPAQRSPGQPDVAALSDAELRVAALASLGCTNREIARRLFITVSTVEQHLTRVYRKLKVGRRADLPADLQVPLPETAVAQSARMLVVAYRRKVGMNNRRAAEVG